MSPSSSLICLINKLAAGASFATLSCISSLAAAPTLPIWRLTPQEYYQREFARRALTLPEDDDHRDQNLILRIFDMSTRKKELRAAQKRGRVVLAFAIMIQVGTVRRRAQQLLTSFAIGRAAVDMGRFSVRFPHRLLATRV